MNYKLSALWNGECEVRNYITFYGSNDQNTRTYYLYIWLIKGNGYTIIVDTGPADIEGFNKATEKYIPGGVKQTPDQATVPLLYKAGVKPEEVTHVILTYLHGDHCSNFPLFKNAKLIVGSRGFLGNMPKGVPKSWMDILVKNWPESLILIDKEETEIVPGVRAFWIGGHSTCSIGVAIDTDKGTAVLGGDTIYLYDNIEEDKPIACPDIEETKIAMQKLRNAGDLVFPGHDPRILERFPGGIIA